MKKKIIKKLVIDELSAVDTPAQEGATVVLMKRHNPITNKVKTMEDETTSTVQKEQRSDEDWLKLERKLKRSTSIVDLSPKDREFFDNLTDEDKKDEFLSLSPENREKLILDMKKNAQESDPVVYTTTDGTVMRKSAGDSLIALAKSNDRLQKRLDASEAALLQKSLEDRVLIELQYMPGTVADRAALLRAVEAMPPENRTGALNALRAQNVAMAKAFETQGVTMEGIPQDHSPQAKLEKMAKALTDKDPNLSPEIAFSRVLDTAEGRELYTASLQ